MTTKAITYTALFLFCGLGGGALGFLEASARLFGTEARFVSVGGIDNDPGACADFEYLTKSPALCTDIARLSPAELRAFAGPRAPSVAFGSPPCKSFSALTDPELAETEAYVEMARLYVVGVELLLSTWDVPPRMIILENVPRIMSKGKHLIDEVLHILTSGGYRCELSTHDCGELGGLAQHRRRALLVARYERTVPALLYRPKLRRVRACGEVLGELPLPETPSAGRMHTMPRISWTTWVRLALIPAGGDYRDLPGVLGELEERRARFRRMHVGDWHEPSVTVGGDGGNGAYGIADERVVVDAPGGGANAVADPRCDVVSKGRNYAGPLGVEAWDAPAGTVTTGGCTGTRASVADNRIAFNLGDSARTNVCAVTDWGAPARCVLGSSRPAGGGAAAADPRIVAPWYRGAFGMIPWDQPTGVITGGGRPSKGRSSVADVRVGRSAGRKPDHSHHVLPWGAPSFTVAGMCWPGCGAYSVGDPRVTEGVGPFDREMHAGSYGVLSWYEAARTITAAGSVDNGTFAIADMRGPTVQPVCFIDSPRRSPFVVQNGKRLSVPVVILAEDGTWHRPMTPLERARLQDLPAVVDGAPLQLHGDDRGAWDERIGNAVPRGAATSIAEQMLLTFLSSDYGAGLVPSGGQVWVLPQLESLQAAAP